MEACCSLLETRRCARTEGLVVYGWRFPRHFSTLGLDSLEDPVVPSVARHWDDLDESAVEQ